MSPPNAIDTTNIEDEIRALRPVPVMPTELLEESEEEPFEDEPEEQPVEEEPSEEEPEEDPEEEVPDSPVTLPTSPIALPASPHVDHHYLSPSPLRMYPTPPPNFFVGESSRGVTRPRPDEPPMRFAPRMRVHSPERISIRLDDAPATYTLSGDPYRPPTPIVTPRLPDPPRGIWIRDLLHSWRHIEGSLVPEVGSSVITPPCTITGESPYDTIPLLAARSYHHEAQFEVIRREFTTIPSLDFFLQVHHGLQILSDEHHNLREHQEHLQGMTISDLGRFSDRMDRFGEELGNFRSMLEDMSTRISRLEDAKSGQGH